MSAPTPPQRREVLVKLSRTLTDEGKLIEAGWVGLRLAILPDNVSDVHVREMRKAFFAGAQHLFSSIMGILDPGADPTTADLTRMDRIAAELDAFAEAFAREHGLPRA